MFFFFFTSAHGKSPVDGIRATMKQLAATEVIKRKVIITDRLSFFKKAREISAIKVFNITVDAVNKRINTPELKPIIDNAHPYLVLFLLFVSNWKVVWSK